MSNCCYYRDSRDFVGEGKGRDRKARRETPPSASPSLHTARALYYQTLLSTGASRVFVALGCWFLVCVCLSVWISFFFFRLFLCNAYFYMHRNSVLVLSTTRYTVICFFIFVLLGLTSTKRT